MPDVVTAGDKNVT